MSSEAISREDSDSSHDHVDFDMKVQGLLAFAVQLHGPKASQATRMESGRSPQH